MGRSSAASTTPPGAAPLARGAAARSSPSSPGPPTRKPRGPARTAGWCASRPSGWASPPSWCRSPPPARWQENARILRDWLAVQPDRPVILASVSKGGSDIKVALAGADTDPAFRNVVAWISLCGILDGTPMATGCSPGARERAGPPLLPAARPGPGVPPRPPLSRAVRRPAGPSAAPAAAHPIDQRRRLPLREHLTRRVSRRCHNRLAPSRAQRRRAGPGGRLRLPGLVYPVWGADHYLQPKSASGGLVRAILGYLDETLDR